MKTTLKNQGQVSTSQKKPRFSQIKFTNFSIFSKSSPSVSTDSFHPEGPIPMTVEFTDNVESTTVPDILSAFMQQLITFSEAADGHRELIRWSPRAQDRQLIAHCDCGWRQSHTVSMHATMESWAD
jgi:hypothetical protein